MTGAPTSRRAPQENAPEPAENLPEFQNLNSSKILKYLNSAPQPITVDNVDNRLDANACLDILKNSSSVVEQKMHKEINNAQNILQSIGKTDLLLINDSHRFNSEISFLKSPPISMNDSNAAAVLRGWESMAAIRNKAKRLLYTEKRITNEIHGEKAGTMDSLTQTLKDKIGKIGENWDKWSGNEKLIFAAGALISTIWFFKTENHAAKSIRSWLKTGAIALGGAYMLNKAFELITGKSLTDRAEDLKADAEGKDFFEKAFGTDKKHAELISKSFSMLGNESLVSLADRYSKAKIDGTHEIKGTSMRPNEAYQALKVFFHRFGGVEHLQEKYSDYQPAISYNQVAVIEMSNDKNINMADNIASQVVHGIGNRLETAYNSLATTSAGVWFREKYRAVFHKEPTKTEIAKFGLRFSNTVKDMSDLNNAIDKNISPQNVLAAKYFKETLVGTLTDQLTNVKYKEAADGYTYLITQDELTTKISNNNALNATTQTNINNMEQFLSKKYNIDPKDVKKDIQVMGSIFVVKTGKVEYFARYKR